MAYKGSRTQRGGGIYGGRTQQQEDDRNTGGSDNSIYNDPGITPARPVTNEEIASGKAAQLQAQQQVYKNAYNTGYRGAGYTTAADRLKQSQQDFRYQPVPKDGRLTETTTGGISTIIKDDTKKDTKKDTGTDTETDDEDKYIDYEYYFDKNGNLDLQKVKKNIGYFQKLTGRKIAKITNDGTIVFADQVGGTRMSMKAIDALSRLADNTFGFKAEKSFESDNANTAATFATMFGNMSKEEFNQFLNRKGNLDRIIDYGASLPEDEREKLQALIKSGDPQGLADRFKQQGMAVDADKFNSYYDKLNNPMKYYADNPPTTQGALEEMAGLDASKYSGDFANQIFAARNEAAKSKDAYDSRNPQGGGIGDFQQQTTDTDTDPTKVPDFVLKRQYMPNFTPSYTGGPEQMQIAGGYYDPKTKKFIGSPWGTQNQYQFNQGGEVSPVRLNAGGTPNQTEILQAAGMVFFVKGDNVIPQMMSNSIMIDENNPKVIRTDYGSGANVKKMIDDGYELAVVDGSEESNKIQKIVSNSDEMKGRSFQNMSIDEPDGVGKRIFNGVKSLGGKIGKAFPALGALDIFDAKNQYDQIMDGTHPVLSELPSANQYIGSGEPAPQEYNQGGIVGTNPLLFKNQGGMAGDNGIKSFKKYGY